MITATQLVQIYGITNAKAKVWVPYIDAALTFAQCDTTQRAACFLAQVGHESGRLRYLREIWGPTKQQLRYEPGTTLATKLGNVEPGDGLRYLGRGLIQTTGRDNYAMTTVKLRKYMDCPDFEHGPVLLETKNWGSISAALFWREKGLNRFADAQDFSGLTKKINGGYNGLADRQALYTRALFVL